MVSIPMHHRGTLLTVGNRLVPIDFTNLVALYTFGEGSGTTLYDRSGNGYNGTINVSCGWTWNSYSKKWSICFDGIDDEITLPNLGFSGDASISIVAVIDNLIDRADKHQIFGFGTTETDNAVCSIRFGTTEKGVAGRVKVLLYRFYFWGNDLDVTEGDVATLPENFTKPFMVSAVYDATNSNRYIYQNSNQVASDSPANPSFDDTAYSVGGFNDEWAEEDIILLMVYNTALSSSQITTLYNKLIV